MANIVLSDKELGKVENHITRLEKQNQTLKMKDRARKAASQAKVVGEIVGTGLIMGAIRGYVEKSRGNFLVPGLDFDAELATGLVVTGIGLVGAQTKGSLQKYSDDILTVGSTILAGFGRGVAKNWAKTGTFSMTGVAGNAGWIGYGGGIAPGIIDSLATSSL